LRTLRSMGSKGPTFYPKFGIQPELQFRNENLLILQSPGFPKQQPCHYIRQVHIISPHPCYQKTNKKTNIRIWGGVKKTERSAGFTEASTSRNK
jgi:hypothetical protein